MDEFIKLASSYAVQLTVDEHMVTLHVKYKDKLLHVGVSRTEYMQDIEDCVLDCINRIYEEMRRLG